MNTILLDWYNKGCSTLKDVKSIEGKLKPLQNPDDKNRNNHSYNIDLMFEHAMNTTPKLKK